MRKLCYFINSDWYFDLHWIDRAIASRDAGYEIHIISHFIDDNIINKFKTFGFICHNVTLDAQSFNALVFFRTYHDVQKIIKNIKPDLLHCITIKPCLIGGVLAKKFNLPVIVSFVGLGRVFSSDSMPLKLLRQFTIAAYKYIASNKRCIFMFEHDRDRKKLAKLVGLEEQQTIVIDGAGINPEIYKYSLEQNHDVPVVLFASRMLWSKGLGDLIEAKKILRSKNIHFTLNVAGILVENDKDAISLQVIENWHQQGLINWLGRSNNVSILLSNQISLLCHLFILKVFREFFWKHLLWVALVLLMMSVVVIALLLIMIMELLLKAIHLKSWLINLPFCLAILKHALKWVLKDVSVFRINSRVG